MSMSRKKVLWVDDEIEYLRSHIMFLETRGYSVIPVFNGDDAIHIISEKPEEFDIVLLDEQMPGKGGLDTLVELKDIAPELPVVMVTKSEEEQVMETAMGLNIDGYLTKPVNPSQILQVCKQILHSSEIMSSQLKQDFVRNFSAIRQSLQNRMDADEWVGIYKSLAKWDIELENTRDEGIRQAHAGQKSDADMLFSEFIIANYMLWMRGDRKPPLFSPKVIDTYIAPRLQSDEKVYFIVLDSMRLDQYMILQPFLRRYYHIDNYTFYSILPSTPEFARNALLSGLYPLEIKNQHPKIWQEIIKDLSNGNTKEAQLLKKKMTEYGLTSSDVEYVRLHDEKSAKVALKNIEKYTEKKLVTIVVDFVDMFIREQATTTILREIAPDEAAFRKLTRSWFEFSKIFQLFKELAKKKCTIVFTSSSGSNLCTRGAEFHWDKDTMKSFRYKYGENISCDERYAFFMHEPERFNLPQKSSDTSCIVLRENYYFVNRSTYKEYNEQYQNTFQRGGISMKEMIVPLAVMKSK